MFIPGLEYPFIGGPVGGRRLRADGPRVEVPIAPARSRSVSLQPEAHPSPESPPRMQRAVYSYDSYWRAFFYEGEEQ